MNQRIERYELNFHQKFYNFLNQNLEITVKRIYNLLKLVEILRIWSVNNEIRYRRTAERR